MEVDPAKDESLMYSGQTLAQPLSYVCSKAANDRNLCENSLPGVSTGMGIHWHTSPRYSNPGEIMIMITRLGSGEMVETEVAMESLCHLEVHRRFDWGCHRVRAFERSSTW